MENRPPESTKAPAAELARLIVSGSKDKEKIGALKKQLGLDRPAAGVPVSRGSETGTGPTWPGDCVGIWKAQWVKGQKVYTRDSKYQADFGFWANVNHIPPKGGKPRILLLGESVARGFLYDPYFTPASVLQTLLNSEPGLPGAEVVDLARSNCSMKELTEITTACFALRPDALVVFAGNNWLNAFTLSDTDIEQIREALASGTRFKGMKQILESKYREIAAAYMSHLADLSRAHRVPVVIIIPAFNLVDFHSNYVQRTPCWPRGETAQWLVLKAGAEQAAAEGDSETVETKLRDMISLNEANPLPYELLGRERLRRGLFDEAGEYLQRALDTSIFNLVNDPACISVIGAALREEAGRYHMEMVDLPDILTRCNSGRPPGRELFLDYCHLTVEGIHIAMASAAQCLFSAMAKRDIPFQQLKERAPVPNRDTQGRAHFFAAIHNSHRGQSYDIVHYHCMQAIEESPSTGKLMRSYIDMASRRIPWAFSQSAEELVMSGALAQYFLLLQPTNQRIMDIHLVDAMAAALESKGIHLQNRVNHLREKNHGPLNGRINLLETYYHLTSYKLNPNVNRHYYQAFEPRSTFFLVTAKEADVILHLTCRVPGKKHRGEKISVLLNGNPAAETDAANKWKTSRFRLPKERLMDGINHVVIQWPAQVDYRDHHRPTQPGESKLEALKRCMYPLYGEIHTFTAVPGNVREAHDVK
jgi:hypothetical protein